MRYLEANNKYRGRETHTIFAVLLGFVGKLFGKAHDANGEDDHKEETRDEIETVVIGGGGVIKRKSKNCPEGSPYRRHGRNTVVDITSS